MRYSGMYGLEFAENTDTSVVGGRTVVLVGITIMMYGVAITTRITSQSM